MAQPDKLPGTIELHEAKQRALSDSLVHMDSCEACRNYRECDEGNRLMMQLLRANDAVEAAKCPKRA